MEDQKRTIPRRWFIRKAAIGAAIGAGGVALIGVLRGIFPPFSKTNKVFTIGRLYDFPIDTYTLMQKRRIFILRDHEGVKVMSAECTHLGCVLDRTDTGFQCPCHGSRFDDQGKLISGPAPRSLPYFKVDLTPDGQLRVDMSQKVSFRDKFFIR